MPPEPTGCFCALSWIMESKLEVAIEALKSNSLLCAGIQIKASQTDWSCVLSHRSNDQEAITPWVHRQTILVAGKFFWLQFSWNLFSCNLKLLSRPSLWNKREQALASLGEGFFQTSEEGSPHQFLLRAKHTSFLRHNFWSSHDPGFSSLNLFQVLRVRLEMCLVPRSAYSTQHEPRKYVE